MRLTIIGFWGGYPGKKEASSGYLIEHDGFKLLLDCGSGVLAQLQEYIKPGDLDAVLLSHFHTDHIADIGVLQHALLIDQMVGIKKDPLPIYAHMENKTEAEKLTYKSQTVWKPVIAGDTVQIGPFHIEALKTKHSVPCYAYVIEAGGKKLAYTADTAYFPELVPFFRDAQVLLCECNFYEGMDMAEKAGHLTSIQAGEIARDAAVQRLILTHLPHFGDRYDLVKQAAKVYTGEIELAKTGLQIQI
jgi:ribonuclease BN (tRNA processing enzyme)